MKIDRAEAKRIAGLAHLEFDDASLDRMAAEMTTILTYIDQLGEAVDAEPLTRSSAPGDGGVVPTPLREDEPRPGVERDAVAANAPSFDGGCFVVPKVIG